MDSGLRPHPAPSH